MEPERPTSPFLFREMHLMKEDSLVLTGQRMTYRLYEGKTPIEQYWIEIEAGNTHACVYVGQNFPCAAKIYTSLLRGEVTPCTLQYIVEDYFG